MGQRTTPNAGRKVFRKVTIPIPTALSPREVTALQQFGKNKMCLDVGSLLGYSTIKLSEVATSVTSLDKHEGYSNGPTFEPLHNNILTYAKSIVSIVKGDALSVGRLFGEVAFIDLTGKQTLTYDTVRALPKEVKTCLIHDCTRSSCHGVEEAVRLLQPYWQPIGQVDTLVIMGRKR